MRTTTCLFTLLFSSGLPAADEPKPSIQGIASNITVTKELGKKNTFTGFMLVEAPKDLKFAYEKASIRVTDQTKIQKTVNGKLVDAKFDEIKNGMKLSVWFTGPVAESFPVKATAGRILILSEAIEY
ncbi:MAG: YobA family protein [Planctomycetes bacterium]|nr:YobA family protein [Planctomycetota bacterium]